MAVNKISGIERRFIDARLTVLGVANDVPSEMTSPYVGLQYIVGAEATGAFAGMSENDIASFNGTSWERIIPKAHQLEVYDKAANAIKRFDGTAWVLVAELASQGDITSINTTIGTSNDAIEALEKTVNGDPEGDAEAKKSLKQKIEDGVANDYVSNDDLDTKVANAGYIKTADLAAQFTDVHEWHTLTAAEASANGFDLEQEVATGMENEVAISVGGVDQIPTVDYVVTTAGNKTSVSWAGKGLNEIGLVEGDVFFIVYKRKIEAAA